jgi:hypothetical protein
MFKSIFKGYIQYKIHMLQDWRNFKKAKKNE